MVNTRNTLYSKTRTCKQPEKFTSNNITNKNNKNLLYFNLLVNTKTYKNIFEYRHNIHIIKI